MRPKFIEFQDKFCEAYSEFIYSNTSHYEKTNNFHNNSLNICIFCGKKLMANGLRNSGNFIPLPKYPLNLFII